MVKEDKFRTNYDARYEYIYIFGDALRHCSYNFSIDNLDAAFLSLRNLYSLLSIHFSKDVRKELESRERQLLKLRNKGASSEVFREKLIEYYRLLLVNGRSVLLPFIKETSSEEFNKNSFITDSGM